MEARAWLSRRLERGQRGGVVTRLASRAWAASVSVERPLRWRDGARVIAVGGSTLGGSGKTPLAIRCAETLHEAGARVALVGHGYGAHPGGPRFVSPGDDVRAVGDEALVCAARLSRYGVPVVVADTVQRALDLALGAADVVVLDGTCQTRPRRASLSLLAVDAASPWGAGLCPPEGDLRAPAAALLAASDRVVATGNGDSSSTGPADRATVVSGGAWLDGRLLGWEELRARRIGVFTAIARPGRVVAMLASHGIRPTVTLLGADHRLPEGLNSSRTLDLWLCTHKCRTHLGPRALLGSACVEGVPVATLDYSLHIEGALTRALLDPCATRP